MAGQGDGTGLKHTQGFIQDFFDFFWDSKQMCAKQTLCNSCPEIESGEFWQLADYSALRLVPRLSLKEAFRTASDKSCMCGGLGTRLLNTCVQ